jgi:hypothetical protein
MGAVATLSVNVQLPTLSVPPRFASSIAPPNLNDPSRSVRPAMLTDRGGISPGIWKIDDAWLPEIVRWSAPGPTIVRFLVMSIAPLVSVIV